MLGCGHANIHENDGIDTHKSGITVQKAESAQKVKSTHFYMNSHRSRFLHWNTEPAQ